MAASDSVPPETASARAGPTDEQRLDALWRRVVLGGSFDCHDMAWVIAALIVSERARASAVAATVERCAKAIEGSLFEIDLCGGGPIKREAVGELIGYALKFAAKAVRAEGGTTT